MTSEKTPAPLSNPGLVGRVLSTNNNVHERIKAFQSAKAQGLFTFRAGRYDRAFNLAMGLGMVYLLGNVGHGVYQMSHGIGRKEGF